MSRLTRRNFLKLSAAAGVAVAGGNRLLSAMELPLGGKDYYQIRPFHERRRYPYLCTLCPYLCPGFAFGEEGVVKKIEGNPDYIATRGKLCPRGLPHTFPHMTLTGSSHPLKGRVKGARGGGRR